MTPPNGQIEPPVAAAIWSDNEADIDLLRFGYLSAEIAAVVTTRELLPVTVGVYGDWGSGKSTLIRLVQDQLAGREGVMALQFNGWLFEGYEDAKTALMGSILDALEDRFQDEKSFSERGRELLGKLKDRVNWLQLASMAGRYAVPLMAGLPHLTVANLGMDIAKLGQAAIAEKGSPSLEDARTLLAAAPEGEKNVRRNIRDFRHDFADMLAESKIETLVVFIDDLDRCLPDTIIETLEAIKLFLFVPGTAFVIGADERLIQYAVRQRFPELPGTEVEVGRNYLEKLVQIPVRVPPLSNADIESYLNLLFAERRLSSEIFKAICSGLEGFRPDSIAELAFDLNRARTFFLQGDVPEQLQEDLGLTAQIVPVLATGLGGNPRRAKRFLNTLLLRLSLGARRGLRLERRILAKLMLLEYIREEFFRALATLQAAENGRPLSLGIAERAVRPSAILQGAVDNDNAPEASEDRARSKAVGRRAQKGGLGSEDVTGKDMGDTGGSELPAEIQPWLADPWTRDWLASDPRLVDVDLGPYFFIAHDRIGAMTGSELRMSPAATEVANRLLSAGGVSQELGLRRSADLSSPDAAAVFQTLAQRIRQAEILDDRSPQGILFRLVQARSELLPQLVSLYGSLPDSKVTAATPPLLIRTIKDTPSASAGRSVVERWSRSKRDILANAAKAALRRA